MAMGKSSCQAQDLYLTKFRCWPHNCYLCHGSKSHNCRIPVHFRSLVKKVQCTANGNADMRLAYRRSTSIVAGVEPRYRVPGSGSNNTSMGSYYVAELGSKVVSIEWETGAVRPVNISILCVSSSQKYLSMRSRFLPDTRSSTTRQFYIQLGEGPQFVITQHRHLAGRRLLECKAQSSDRCLSDNMFGLTAGSDV